ncbi:hypothetical protein [Pseudomonas sp. Pseusp16]|uniref:hypothetical protein n=1 Tax=Pseudomonas sp. Pseusp16 TaxID=3243021 RepID=UPI0039B5EF21
MEPIRIYSHPKPTGFSVIEPVTKLELELLAGYRRLSSDDQMRILSVLQAMASVKQAE